MKSRISYFDKTIFRKDMTRFAPAWILYTICLVMGMLLLRQDTSGYGFHSNLSSLIPVMSVINLCYALLAAQLLFGDLYNTRMCNAIHALPVTRERLLGSHVIAGLAWSVLPSIAGTLMAILLGIGSEVEQGWHLALWWMLGTNLQYLFFFGLAAFCALCVGNRFAQAVVYAITNFASLIVFWLVDTLYIPMLYGLQTDDGPFARFSPVVWFANAEYLAVNRIWNNDRQQVVRCWYKVADGWGYLVICAVIGVALLAATCLLYRRRRLECAGDFMAVKAMEPVFLVVYSLVMAAVFHFFVEEVVYISGISMVYLVIGLAVGFFTGVMLLERTIRIFRKKTFLKFAALALCFGATLLVTALDPFGTVTWIPEQEDVAYVEVTPSHGSYYRDYNVITLDEPDEIADTLRTHEIALEERIAHSGYGYYTLEYPEDSYMYNYQSIAFHYHLNNGIVKSRYYYIDLDGEAGELMIPRFSTLEAIFREYDGDKSFEGILNATQTISVGCDSYAGADYKQDVDGYSVTIANAGHIRELLEAIAADCELGVMAQNWEFRPDREVVSAYWLDFDMGNQMESLTVYSDCVNTCAWLEEHGFISEELLEQEKNIAACKIAEVTTEFETG